MLVLANLVIIAAFTAQPAFVHNGADLNRELSEFLNEITLRKNVAICYHKYGITPQHVANLAWNACESLIKQHLSCKLCVCLLMTPIAAIYECAESAFNGTLDSY